MRTGNNDHESWDSGPKDAEPPPAAEYVSSGLLRLLVYTVLIVGLAGVAVLWILSAR